ncbi:hypothetical protein PARPLA_01939 [Rhodobacteraceae bacterium THAF1]|uniref:DUF1638 domain-containing protein n=1 Tax=Palleronia sp. THAF1 TaxID=2587842 RepID=UPI000F40002C|nr:DUF1638 domain-containing protein [Palleronia sp. THAF1]QFU08926.1 hypothetical protein FIU81_09600 [Palleronia sp. THAF1]VDC24354.1 hypothetical protein PARPLA_01939 [Rhodobacteraceae bacterium THAF1]
MSLPDDHALTEDGIAPNGRGRVLVLACGALAREITALTRQTGLSHVDLACLPAILHNTPARIVTALRAAVERHREDYDTILIGYGDCGTGGEIDALCAELGLDRLPGAHCYAFFEGVDAFAARDEIDAFYLTDFLARQFDAFVTRPLGLDRHPELRDMYFGNYRKVVFMAQTDDAVLTEKAKAAADALGLGFERRFTGYGDLETTVTGL